MIRLTLKPCKNCGHPHQQYTSTGEWELAATMNMVYTTGCFDCNCVNYEPGEKIDGN